MTFFKGSRYQNVPLFEPLDSGEFVFKGLRARPVGPAEGTLEHTVVFKDRLDSLGQNYYSDPRGWYRIAEANIDVLFPEDLIFDDLSSEENSSGPENSEKFSAPLGRLLLIPRRKEEGS